MKPIISVEGLGKSYTIRHEGQTRYKSLREEIFTLPKRLLSKGEHSLEEFWALKDVNFDIMPGDRVGIIGRNGAGKSTLLKLLSRITEPTTGRITMRGRVASLLEVGTGFHPELTGRENIYLNGAILGMTRAEVRRKFDEIVDFAGVEKFLDTPVKRYSSGMYVRLAFAVAAHLEPEILVVDEVLAVGDAEFQKKCIGKMEDVSKGQGRTVLFVSHNMSAIRQLCHSGLLLESGSVALNETNVYKIIQQYVNILEKDNTPIMGHMSCGDYISIKHIYVKKTSESLTIDESFVIEVHFLINKECSPGFTVSLSDENNVIVFSSIINNGNLLDSVLPIGEYIVQCEIPGVLLNAGTYYVNLTVFREEHVDAKSFTNVLAIVLNDTQTLRGKYVGGFPGLMRPRLKWNLVKV